MSEEAYRALSELKGKKESFTDVILRLASERGNASKLLALIRSFEADEELAANTEKAMAWRATLKLRNESTVSVKYPPTPEVQSFRRTEHTTCQTRLDC